MPTSNQKYDAGSAYKSIISKYQSGISATEPLVKSRVPLILLLRCNSDFKQIKSCDNLFTHLKKIKKIDSCYQKLTFKESVEQSMCYNYKQMGWFILCDNTQPWDKSGRHLVLLVLFYLDIQCQYSDPPSPPCLPFCILNTKRNLLRENSGQVPWERPAVTYPAQVGSGGLQPNAHFFWICCKNNAVL